MNYPHHWSSVLGWRVAEVVQEHWVRLEECREWAQVQLGAGFYTTIWSWFEIFFHSWSSLKQTPGARERLFIECSTGLMISMISYSPIPNLVYLKVATMEGPKGHSGEVDEGALQPQRIWGHQLFTALNFFKKSRQSICFVHLIRWVLSRHVAYPLID